MTVPNDRFRVGTEENVLGYVSDLTSPPDTKSVPMIPAQPKTVLLKGLEFAASIKGKWLLIAGELNSNGTSPEVRVRQSCLDAFGYPPGASKINVLVDSADGSLDSAYKIALYLSRYAKELNVYVPRQAKSASTLIALGADCTYLSEFGELGPLDTQVRDPRDPARSISALDCYQSVEHVRRFGFDTMTEALRRLREDSSAGLIPLADLLDRASEFAFGAMKPILEGVNAFDFGAWGRSLQIGARYARILLKSRGFEPQQADEIARQLVYGYPHHPFPIDYTESRRIGLKVGLMDEKAYAGAQGVLKACRGKSFVGFISEQEAKQEEVAKVVRQEAEQERWAETRLGPQASDIGDIGR